MAERRMFAKTIIDSDAFLDMPHSTQLLYFHLSMRADDDGFINNPKNIMRMIGCKDDDLSVLITKKFIIPFESGVVVIKHWKIHNYIAKDRYKETKYKDEKALLQLDENNSYTTCIQPVYKMETQVRLSKDSIGKYNIYGQNDQEDLDYINKFEEFYKQYPRKVKKQDVEKWFKKNKPTDELFKKIIDSLNKFKNSYDWKKDNGQFIPYPSTWLNQKRWEDESILSEQKIKQEVKKQTNFNNYEKRDYTDLNSLYKNGG